MKKFTALLLATLFALTACGRSLPGSTGSSDPSGSVQTGATDRSDREPETSGPSPVQSTGTTDSDGTDRPSTSGGSTSPNPTAPPPAFEEVYRPVEGSDALWELIPDGWEIPVDSVFSSGDLMGDRLLISYGVYLDEGLFDEYGEPIWETEWHILLVDLSRGSLIGEYQVPSDLYDAGFLADGSVWMTCLTDSERHPDLFGYDIVRFSDFPEGRQTLEGVDFDDFCGVSDDGTVWVYDSDKGALSALTPFDDRPDGNFSAPGWNSARWLGQGDDGDPVYFAANDRFGTPVTVSLSRESGRFTEHPYLRDAGWGDFSLLTLNQTGIWALAFPDDPDRVYTFPKAHEYNSMAAASGRYFAESDYDGETERGSLAVYDAQTGRMFGRLYETDGIGGLAAIGMDDGGRLYAYAYGGGGIRILLWRYDAGESRPTKGFRILDTSEADAGCVEIAEEIYEKYGIRVFWDELSLNGLVWDYTCEVIENSRDIQKSLKLLSDALAKYPAGIFAEMTADQFSGLELYLCGTFTPTDGTGISSAAAITSTRYGSLIVMAFNINYPDQMEQNLSHELMHVMEHRLEAYCEEKGIPYADQWAALNPKGFAYYDSYHDASGNEISDATDTAWSESARAWFVDPYSKSYATEDRARVFENLYMNNIYLFDSPHLRAKGQYLCQLIRAAFPSVGAMDRASWEILG